jgi:hypothetical protein
MLYFSQPESQAMVDQRLANASLALGMALREQRRYLAEHEYLHPETKAIIRKDKIGVEKSLPLTTPKIRQDQEVQVKISMLGMSDRPEKLP